MIDRTDALWKLLINADGTGAERYDLAAGPYEAHNLSLEQVETAARWTKLALTWRRSLP